MAEEPRPRIDGKLYALLLSRLGEVGRKDVEWSEGVLPPVDAESFAWEAIWIICNSGMKHDVARVIERRVADAIREGRPVSTAFGHPGKAAAMQAIWDRREEMFRDYVASEDKMAYIASMPWIGQVTKFHLAKNFGLDVAKPDVHLARLAQREGEDVQAMCARVAAEVGVRVATVDLVLWRACATGLLDSRSGRLRDWGGACMTPDDGA